MPVPNLVEQRLVAGQPCEHARLDLREIAQDHFLSGPGDNQRAKINRPFHFSRILVSFVVDFYEFVGLFFIHENEIVVAHENGFLPHVLHVDFCRARPAASVRAEIEQAERHSAVSAQAFLHREEGFIQLIDGAPSAETHNPRMCF